MKRARLRNRQATHKVGRLVGAELDVDGPSRCEVDGTVEFADSAATLCCTPPLNPTEGTGPACAKRTSQKTIGFAECGLDRTAN